MDARLWRSLVLIDSSTSLRSGRNDKGGIASVCRGYWGRWFHGSMHLRMKILRLIGVRIGLRRFVGGSRVEAFSLLLLTFCPPLKVEANFIWMLAFGDRLFLNRFLPPSRKALEDRWILIVNYELRITN